VEDEIAVGKEGLTMSKLLLGVEAFNFLETEGFSVLKSVLVQDDREAARVAATIGFPVAIKISSQNAIHKTEAGGVKVDLNSEVAVVEAFKQVMRSFEEKYPTSRPDGVIIQKQGGGFELIVGTLTDPQFGPVIMFGLGGIFAEAMHDASFRLVPIQAGDARAMMEELRGYEALKKPRKDLIDLAVIEHFLVRISDCIVRHPEIQEMDLNPVFVSSCSIEICDARIGIG
jgi:hypothetical protein